MTVGIVGLGLIGGSFAKAYHAAGHRVLGCDTDASTLEFSMLSGVVEGPLTDENLRLPRRRHCVFKGARRPNWQQAGGH